MVSVVSSRAAIDDHYVPITLRFCARCEFEREAYLERLESLGDPSFRHGVAHRLAALEIEVQELKKQVKELQEGR